MGTGRRNTRTPRTLTHTQRVWLQFLLMFVAAVGSGWYAGHQSGDTANEKAVTMLRELNAYIIDGCERRVADSQVNSESIKRISVALRGQSDYLNLVLDAESVKQDVKDAAKVNQGKQNWAATYLEETAVPSLESRSGENFDCTTAFPIDQILDAVEHAG